MKAHAPAILLATFLVYVAHAFYHKDASILDNTLIAVIYGVIAFILKYGFKYGAKLAKKEIDYDKLSIKWTSSLLFGLIAAMVIVNLDVLSNMYVHTPNLYLFFGPVPAAVTIGLLATILTFVKNREPIPYSRAYAIVSVVITAILVGLFVYAGSDVA